MRAHYPHCARPAFVCAREMEAYRENNPAMFAKPEPERDPRRGETRFAAEVALDELSGRDVPREAHDRAMVTLRALANG